ncbi:hypothetical protein EON65_48985 [archaeon]|nr:MAG: hypothetical protein EON65_48985 [archaeon]
MQDPGTEEIIASNAIFIGSSTQPTTLLKGPYIPLDSFSWSEQKELVKLYVDFKGAGDVLDTDICLVRKILV